MEEGKKKNILLQLEWLVYRESWAFVTGTGLKLSFLNSSDTGNLEMESCDKFFLFIN